MGGLLKLADVLDGINRRLGWALSYLVLALVVLQFALVVMSANFQLGSIKMQEGLLYLNALLFLGAAGYTMLKDGHVRVDIFYRGKPERTKNLIDFLGHVFLLLPFLAFVWIIGVPYVLSSWAFQEGSFETSGLQIVYILKTALLLFALTLTLQAISGIIRTLHKIRGHKIRGGS